MAETTNPSPNSRSPMNNPRHDRDHIVDDGEPSGDVQTDLLRVVALVEDERHLVADKLLQSCKARLRVMRKQAENNTAIRQQLDAAMMLISNADFEKLEKLAYIFKTALKNTTQNEGWIRCHSHRGIISYYRREADHSLSIKIEGEISGAPLFEQMAVIRECDLYKHWAPFMNRSKKIAELGLLDQIGWYEVSIPIFGFVRDACFRSIGCDDMYENGRVLVVAQGIQDGAVEYETNSNGGSRSSSSSLQTSSDYDRKHFLDASLRDNNGSHLEEDCHEWLEKDPFVRSLELPPKPQGLNKGRIEIRFFEGVIDILSPNRASTRIVANMNLHLRFLPQALIDFGMKKMAGMLIVYIQKAAQKAVDDPEKSPHAIRMRQDNFYQGWLLPKFKAYCRTQGWSMPRVNSLQFKAKPRQVTSNRFSFSGSSSPSRSPKDRSYLNSQSLPTNGSPSGIYRSRESILRKNFSSDQLDRLRELKSHSRSWDTLSRDDDTSVGASYVSYDGRQPSKIETISRLINEPPHFVMLPLLFALMFGSFYMTRNESFLTDESAQIAYLRYLIYIPGQLFLYTFLHWSIVETMLVTLFDSIQLPFDRDSAPTIRLYYIDMIRYPLMAFSSFLMVLSFLKVAFIEIIYYAIEVFKGGNAVGRLTGTTFARKVIYNCKAMMTYSSVFLFLCFLLFFAILPTRKKTKSVKASEDIGEFESSIEGDFSLDTHPLSPVSKNGGYYHDLSAIGSIDEVNEDEDE